MAVVSATRRLNALSRCSSSSWGLGTSTSGTGRHLAHLLAHRVAPGLERAHQPLRLLLEELAPLVEQLAGALAEEPAILLAGLRGEEQRGDAAQRRAEQEPAEIGAAAAAITRHGGCL